MATVLLSIAVVFLAVAGLAAGVLAGRPPPKGSCGGLACLKVAGCEACFHADRRPVSP
ncbi:MAG: hypothetical protein ACTSU0_05710 [Alphaproteobacteria bacterium]